MMLLALGEQVGQTDWARRLSDGEQKQKLSLQKTNMPSKKRASGRRVRTWRPKGQKAIRSPKSKSGVQRAKIGSNNVKVASIGQNGFQKVKIASRRHIWFPKGQKGFQKGHAGDNMQK